MIAQVDGVTTDLAQEQTDLARIGQLDRELADHFRHAFAIQPSLSRQLVSFQANKTRSAYRWYKYKEAFSASLVEHLGEVSMRSSSKQGSGMKWRAVPAEMSKMFDVIAWMEKGLAYVRSLPPKR
jgi:hypothetical protein